MPVGRKLQAAAAGLKPGIRVADLATCACASRRLAAISTSSSSLTQSASSVQRGVNWRSTRPGPIASIARRLKMPDWERVAACLREWLPSSTRRLCADRSWTLSVIGRSVPATRNSGTGCWKWRGKRTTAHRWGVHRGGAIEPSIRPHGMTSGRWRNWPEPPRWPTNRSHCCCHWGSGCGPWEGMPICFYGTFRRRIPPISGRT